MPLTISPGHAAKFYIKTGLQMASIPYRSVVEKFGIGDERSILAVIDFLHSMHTDFYGNKVFSPAPGFPIVQPEGRREQLFVVILKTSRGTSAQGIVSWYSHAGTDR